MSGKDLRQLVKSFWELPKPEAMMWVGKYLKSEFKRASDKAEKIKNIRDYEMRIYSQNGEDGILRAIFERMGTTNQYFVEFGVESGRECNTRRLRETGWRGLWMDAAYEGNGVKKEKVTPGNIERLLSKYRVPREPDLLSIDIDGNDYWVWEAIRHYRPRVVVIEYNAGWGPREERVAKYEADFAPDGTNNFGASLAALEKLGRKKGYVLLGCDGRGVNAFFGRKDAIEGKFEIRSEPELYRPAGYGPGAKKGGRSS